MNVTQKEIARRAGVSQSLVARALRDHPHVADETRQRILAVAHDMGYREHSNSAARALIAQRYGKRASTGVISVLMVRAEAPFHGEPFFASLLDGIEAEVNERWLEMHMCPFSPHHPLPRWIIERMVDGVIVLGGTPAVDQMANLDLPLVSLVSWREGAHNLLVENQSGTCLAVRHLAGLGHRRIAYVGPAPGPREPTERLEGYRQGAQECGLRIYEDLIEATMTNMVGGAEAAERLLGRTHDFTALVCYNDFIAMAAMRYLNGQGLRVPADVSVVGFDDITPQYHFQPTLTSIAFDRVAMGRRAVELITELSSAAHDQSAPGDGNSELRDEVFSVQLVERESTRPI